MNRLQESLARAIRPFVDRFDRRVHSEEQSRQPNLHHHQKLYNSSSNQKYNKGFSTMTTTANTTTNNTGAIATCTGIALLQSQQRQRHMNRLFEQFGNTTGETTNKLITRIITLPYYVNSLETLIGLRGYNSRKIEKFSGAKFNFLGYSRVGGRCRAIIHGSIAQHHFATKALDAIIADNFQTGKFYVLLKLAGPKLRRVHEQLNVALSRSSIKSEYLYETSELHITAALLTHIDDQKLNRLIEVVEDAANHVRRVNNEKRSIGYLNQVFACKQDYMSMGPDNFSDALYSIRDDVWRRLQTNDLVPRYTTPPLLHMTIARKRYITPDMIQRAQAKSYHSHYYSDCFRTNLSHRFLQDMSVKPDFGPLRVSKITISEVSRGTGGYKFVDVKHFSTL